MTPERRKMPRCEAYRCGDQMLCRCGIQWDRDDSDPPACGRATINDRKEKHAITADK
jgi:hypothetical protein